MYLCIRENAKSGLPIVTCRVLTRISNNYAKVPSLFEATTQTRRLSENEARSHGKIEAAMAKF